jgi:hypothetical protein
MGIRNSSSIRIKKSSLKQKSVAVATAAAQPTALVPGNQLLSKSEIFTYDFGNHPEYWLDSSKDLPLLMNRAHRSQPVRVAVAISPSGLTAVELDRMLQASGKKDIYDYPSVMQPQTGFYPNNPLLYIDREPGKAPGQKGLPRIEVVRGEAYLDRKNPDWWGVVLDKIFALYDGNVASGGGAVAFPIDDPEAALEVVVNQWREDSGHLDIYLVDKEFRRVIAAMNITKRNSKNRNDELHLYSVDFGTSTNAVDRAEHYIATQRGVRILGGLLEDAHDNWYPKKTWKSLTQSASKPVPATAVARPVAGGVFRDSKEYSKHTAQIVQSYVPRSKAMRSVQQKLDAAFGNSISSRANNFSEPLDGTTAMNLAKNVDALFKNNKSKVSPTVLHQMNNTTPDSGFTKTVASDETLSFELPFSGNALDVQRENGRPTFRYYGPKHDVLAEAKLGPAGGWYNNQNTNQKPTEIYFEGYSLSSKNRKAHMLLTEMIETLTGAGTAEFDDFSKLLQTTPTNQVEIRERRMAAKRGKRIP